MECWEERERAGGRGFVSRLWSHGTGVDAVLMASRGYSCEAGHAKSTDAILDGFSWIQS